VLVRVRLGTGLSGLAAAPLLSIDLDDGATVEDLYGRLRAAEPELAPSSERRCPSSPASTSRATGAWPTARRSPCLLPISGG
jgi:hypothetical protein